MQNTDKKIELNAPERKSFNIKDFSSQIIPQSFQLGGLTIDVLFQEKLAKNAGMIGVADYAVQQIRLDPTITTKQTTEQAYFHELTHWILFTMGEAELCNNEKFVDVFAHFFYQALKTSTPYPKTRVRPDEVPLPDEHDERLCENDSDGISFDEDVFRPDEKCEISDYRDEDDDDRNSLEHQMTMEEIALEEEQDRTSREAGFEEIDVYRDGMALSDEEGWFYDDGD